MRYEATIVESDGATVRELLDAGDEQELHDQLGRAGRLLVAARPLEGRERGGTGRVGSSKTRLSPRRLLMLTQALCEVLDAGVPLLMAFEAIAEQEDDPAVAALLEDLGARIESGEALSGAMRAHPRAFSPVYRSLVRAGEQSGKLPEVLHSVAGFLEWRIEIAGTVRQAMVYPLLVGIAGYGMVLFMLSFVIPRLGDVLAKMGGELPAASRVLIGMSDFVAANIGWIVLASFASVVAFVLLMRRESVSAPVRNLLSRLPVVRTVVHTLSVAQFCRTLAVLLHSGLTMSLALELGGDGVAVPRIRDRLHGARDRILGGARLGEALGEAEVLPPVALSMVHVGEEAGRLPTTFDRLARVYDREVRDAVKKALGMLEPAVTVLLGVIVGGVAVLVVMTIYSAMRGIGK